METLAYRNTRTRCDKQNVVLREEKRPYYRLIHEYSDIIYMYIIRVLSLHFTQKRVNKNNYNINTMDETSSKIHFVFFHNISFFMLIKCYLRELDSKCSTEVIVLCFVLTGRICGDNIGVLNIDRYHFDRFTAVYDKTKVMIIIFNLTFFQF